MPIQPGDVKITNITPIARLDAQGRDTRLYNVQFTIRDKITDAIEIPRDQYTKERAMQMILALANEHIGLLDM